MHERFGAKGKVLVCLEQSRGAGLAPRLLTAFGTDRDRFEVAGDLLNLSGIAPVRIASGKKTDKKASVHFRRACPKFLRQSFHEFGECSIRYCPWAQACYQPNAIAAKVTMPLYAQVHPVNKIAKNKDMQTFAINVFFYRGIFIRP